MSTPPEAAQVIVATDIVPAVEGLACQQALFDAAVAGAEQEVSLLWRSAPALIATSLDAALPDFVAARATLEAEGWPVLTRRSGGGAFAIGPGTLQLAMIGRRGHPAHAIDAAYDALARPIVQALDALGLDARVGSVPGAVCGGRYDIAVGGRKVAGLAQRGRRAADGTVRLAASASLIVDADAAELTGIVNRFYALAGGASRYRPDAMTSIAAQLPAGEGGRMDADLTSRVVSALETALQPPASVSGPAAAA